jgi:hypothetical protein
MVASLDRKGEENVKNVWWGVGNLRLDRGR